MLFMKDEDIQNLINETAKAVKEVEDETTVKVKRQEDGGVKTEPGLTPLPDLSGLETGHIHEQSVRAKQEKQRNKDAQRDYQYIIDDWLENHPDKPLNGSKMFREDDSDKIELHDNHRFYASLVGIEVEFIRKNGMWETGVCVDFESHVDFSYWMTIGMFDGRTYTVQLSRCRIKGGWQDAQSTKESIQSDTEKD